MKDVLEQAKKDLEEMQMKSYKQGVRDGLQTVLAGLDALTKKGASPDSIVLALGLTLKDKIDEMA